MRRSLVALAVVATSAACSGDGEPSAATTTVAGPTEVAEGPVAAVALVPGDCLSGIVVGTAERARITDARKVSCQSDHPVEVFATMQLGAPSLDVEVVAVGAEYPGQQRIVDAADRACTDALIEVAGTTDRFGILALWPTRESWNQGDRTIVCAVFDPDGELFSGPQFA